jgi:hypothetical protein
MIIAKKKIIVYRECTSDVPIRRCRFQSANTLECQSYFGSSPYPLCLLHCTLKTNTKSWVLEKLIILLLIFDFRNGLEALPFLFKIFFFRVAIFGWPFVLKLSYANCRNLT